MIRQAKRALILKAKSARQSLQKRCDERRRNPNRRAESFIDDLFDDDEYDGDDYALEDECKGYWAKKDQTWADRAAAKAKAKADAVRKRKEAERRAREAAKELAANVLRIE